MSSFLEKRAYNLAAANHLCFFDNWNEDHHGYDDLCECVAKGEEPDHCCVWEPLEHMAWEKVIELIDTNAQSILLMLKETLELAKKGIVESAIDGSLDSDMNQIDMNHMVELGLGTKNTCVSNNATSKTVKFVISNGDNLLKDKAEVSISVRSFGHILGLQIEGYSDCCSNDSKGMPIYLENHSGKLCLVVFADINQEDPTHMISLCNTRNEARGK